LTHNEHTPFIENLSAYALGALDAEDIATLEVPSKDMRFVPDRNWLDSAP